MSVPQIDHEMLAAFLDGTATPDERETVLRRVAGSRDAYAELREAAAIRGGLRGEMAPADAPEQGVFLVPETSAPGAAPLAPPASTLAIVPGGARKRRFRYAVRVVMLAAAGLAIVVVKQTPRPQADGIAIAQAIRVKGATGSGSLARTLGAEWDDQQWTVTRGEARASGRPASHAFRLGLRYAQLQVTLNSRDTAAMLRTRGVLQGLLQDTEASGPLSRQLDRLGSAGSTPDALNGATFASDVRALVEQPTWFDLGVWTGAAQIAARAGDATFFAAAGREIAELKRLLSEDVVPADEWRSVTRTLSPLAVGVRAGQGGMDELVRTLTQIAVISGH